MNRSTNAICCLEYTNLQLHNMLNCIRLFYRDFSCTCIYLYTRIPSYAKVAINGFD